MKTAKQFLTLATFLLGIGYGQACLAGQIVFGPFPDFRGFINVPVTVQIPTIGKFTVHIPFDGNLSFFFRDRITIRVNVPVPIFAATYIRLGVVGDPQLEPDALLTDIYALDLGNPLGGPDGDVPQLTGFDPANPQIEALSPEEFITESGGIYPANVQAMTLAELRNFLPDYDLSQFSGDPASLVFVAQAIVPLADITVPEPATLVLIALSLMACAHALRRRKPGLWAGNGLQLGA